MSKRPTNYDQERALGLLRAGTGQRQAVFREGQEEAIRLVVEGGCRLLVVERTGWGKSFVYFIATKLLRERGAGPTLLISPLLALMRNQIAAAERMGVRATRIASDNHADWQEEEGRLRRDEVDVMFIAPERLGNERFRREVLERIAERINLLVIDEAHCISDWGHDFRPHYRLIERIARTLPPNSRLLATTATANDRVMDDLKTVLGPNLRVRRGDLNRPTLKLQSIRLAHQSERLAWLAKWLPQLPGSGVIYTLTVRDAGRVAEWLQSRGLAVEAYTGQTGDDDRETLEQALLDNRVKALVATPALGMGFDKPDLGFVIHYQTPGSVVTYYQQVGRAGRALDNAYGVLLSGAEDTDITDYFIASAFPTREEVKQVIDALEVASDGLSVPELERRVNLSRRRIDTTIKLLSIESPPPIAPMGTKWQLTAATLGEEFWKRTERLTELRRYEQHQMHDYAELESGHMEFLIRALDGDPASVRPPDLPLLPKDVEPGILRDALTFLRRTSLIKPRHQWPPGGMRQLGTRGRIPPAHRAEEGRALSIWGDAGWGGLVQRGKYRDSRFADNLVHACTELMAQWAPQPAPEWVTCIPSRRHPTLVPDFAKRLAEQMGLPFHASLSKVEDRPEQKLMANGAHQAHNVDGSLALSLPLPAGPVLLVDDMVDSGWTFTVAAWLLRSNGSGDVWPLALASTS